FKKKKKIQKMDSESQILAQIESEIQKWWDTPRYTGVKRPYTARQVASLRPSIHIEYPSNIQAKKMWRLLKDAQLTGNFHMTYGALDPIQVINLSKYLKTVYVSGWQCSVSASTTNEPGPDFADYPADTVPNKVDQLFKAQLNQDKIQNQERSSMTPEQRAKKPRVDYLAPLLADADAGFGGLTSTMKLIKLFIQAGAAGIHIEDQRPGNKKCGHMGGKVIVSCREHVNRLIACRLQADIMGTELIILARTDALGAKLIDSNIDPIDQPYILGICDDGKERSFPEAGLQQIKKQFQGAQRDQISQQWMSKCYTMSYQQAIQYAKTLGFSFQFDWETNRSSEGFYNIEGSPELCAARANEYLKYADMVWMETPTPTIETATKFASLVKKVHPNKLLAYNLSPSFNWSAFGMSNEYIQGFCEQLGKLGYSWQFITLAGFHMNALKSEQLSKDLAQRHMLAYVETVQREEEKHKVDQLTHQKWSGVNYVDECLTLIQPDSKTLANSIESTENQFSKNH
ncbi:isocitrate lyase, putative, partial [Ichthyophthirius multifiliis]